MYCYLSGICLGKKKKKESIPIALPVQLSLFGRVKYLFSSLAIVRTQFSFSTTGKFWQSHLEDKQIHVRAQGN